MEDKVSVNIVGCFGFCSQGPFVKIFPEDTLYRLVRIEDVEEIFQKDILSGEVVERLLYVEPLTGEKVAKQDDINFYKKQKRVALHGGGVINPESIEEAMGYGAFQGLERALKMSPQEVIDEVLASGLRGRGGGGFPSGRKWQFAKNSVSDQKYVVCNGDEGDPGAFMDRSILEGNPYSVIEGMMIAGYAIGASEGYFYVRAEYPIAVNRLRNAIKQMNEAGILGENILGTGFHFQAHIRLGAGAFVCGEETALLNSIEGKRGMPRPRPPFPAVKGLWGEPTIVNNVETLACVPYILREGAAEFASCGTKRMLEILTRITEGNGTMEDLQELEELGNTVKNNSLCALGQTAANPIMSTLAHFREEYIAHIVDKTCPAKVCKNLMRYTIEQDSCVGCGRCAKACPADAIYKTDYIAPGKKLASYQIDANKCVKCGACMATCKLHAIVKK